MVPAPAVGWHQREGEAEPGGFGKPATDAFDAAHLAGKPHLADRRRDLAAAVGPRAALATASAMARSPAGSVSFTPPTVAVKTSSPESRRLARRSVTASTIETRAASRPDVVRRGVVRLELATSACTSATSGRRPSSATVTQVPGTGVAASRKEQAARIGEPDDAALR